MDPGVAAVIGLCVLLALWYGGGHLYNRRRGQRLFRWLEMGLDTDVELLEYILSGRIAETKIGLYLQKLNTLFPKTVMLDMLCFLRIHLELAIRAKGLLLMQGAGFRISADSEIGERFRELKFLEKSIGKTGILALSPILHSSSRDIWQLSLLKRS